MAAARVAVAGASVRGASHVRSNAPNQDAVRWRRGSGPTEAVVVAVADGHGSPRSFRSHLGAELAVVVATEMLWTRFADAPADRKPQEETSSLRRLLPEVTERWAAAVRRELEERPFEADELGTLEERAGSTALAELERNPLLAYGATLLTVLVSGTAVHYAQLGDGDILAVWRNGEVRRRLPPDPRLIANETTSLCQPSAWQQFRVGSDSLDGAPRLILLSTDGYANSFATEKEFLQVGSDLLQMIERDGLKVVEGRLEGWLNETSEHGAGDDVTLAIISVPFSTAEPPPAVLPPARTPATLRMSSAVPPLTSPMEHPPWGGPEGEPMTGGPRLVVRVDGRTYDVTGLRRVRIGRDPSADVRSGNRFVSKQHALLRSGRAGWTLEDLGSRGGLWHGGRRLERLAIVEPAEVWLGRPGEGDLMELFPGDHPAPAQTDRRRRTVLAGIGALLALLLVAGLGWMVLRPAPPSSPPLPSPTVGPPTTIGSPTTVGPPTTVPRTTTTPRRTAAPRIPTDWPGRY